MFDKLEDLLHRFEEILNELNEPTVTEDQKRFRALMKEPNLLWTFYDSKSAPFQTQPYLIQHSPLKLQFEQILPLA